MQSRDIGRVAIDECKNCKGIWFDPGEIDDVKDEISTDLRWLDFDFWRKNAEFQMEQSPLYCPCCKETSLTTVSESDSGAAVRFCTACGGTWLKASDLAKIVSSLNREVEKKSAADYFKESLKQAAELLTGKGDLISEWKDLKEVLRLLKYRIFIENPKLNAIMQGLQKTLPL